MTRRHIRLAPLALALMVSACGSASTSPTTTTSGLTTENFTGTVAVAGTDSKTFTVTVTGEVDVTLTSASPSVFMGLAVGVPGASGCVPLAGASQTVAAGTLVQVAGEVTPGTFCVLVSALENQTAPVTYSVTVVHP